MTIFKKIIFSFILVALAVVVFPQEAKNALLIANNNYSGSIPSLPEPVGEARDLKRALESIGFNVIIVENADRERMEDALFSFKEKCKNDGGIAFFHYGGHAVQIDGVNYLLPARTSLDRIGQVRGKCVNVNNLMENMQGDVNIVVLDSCRNNPFSSGTRGGAKRGLAAIDTKVKNSIIVYSADSDEEARDGVFTPILTQYITEPNLSITELLIKVRNEVLNKTSNQQEPAEYGKLLGQVYLAGRDLGIASKTLKGFLDISTYTLASVVIDNEYVGEVEGFSQKRFEIASGAHRIKVKYKDGKTEDTKVVIKSGKIEKLDFKYLSEEQIKLSVELANKYLKGVGGVTKDYDRAFEYAKIASDAGERDGEYIVGYCFEAGLGVSKDEGEALKWYIKAQKKGNGDAMWKLGTFYHYGKGKLKKDYKEAQRLYEKAITSNCSEEGIKSARDGLEEIKELLATEVIAHDSSSLWSGDFWSLEVNFCYSLTHFVTKNNELKFNAHGLTLGLTEARFHFKNGFDIKVRTDYIFGVKNFSTEIIRYHDFNCPVGQIGYRHRWFGFHAGFACSFQWETVVASVFLGPISNFNFGARFPIDLEVSINDRFILYAEYSPRIILVSAPDIIPFIQNTFNMGLQIRIVSN